jgi:uncharacterized coiled-coil DUF342 family protein
MTDEEARRLRQLLDQLKALDGELNAEVWPHEERLRELARKRRRLYEEIGQLIPPSTAAT